MPVAQVFYLYVCPTVGSILSTIMFAAPVNDLRQALHKGSFGVLNPFPFVMMAGNCLGWIIYGHLLRDPFLVASNMAGFICSVWLNMGSAKLQYHIQFSQQSERDRIGALMTRQEQWDASLPMDDNDDDVINDEEEDQFVGLASHDGESHGGENNFTRGGHPDGILQLTMVPQEIMFFRIMCAWAALATYCTWFTDTATGANIVAWTVNINLVFFYGAPLNTIFSVVQTGDSAAIHRSTLQMSFVNTSFWILYGIAVHNPFIVVPNATGLLLGIIQGMLCLFYPPKMSSAGNLTAAADESSPVNPNTANRRTPVAFSLQRFLFSSLFATTPVSSFSSSLMEGKRVVVNPLTKRPIQVYGPTYQKMLQSGYVFHAGELYPILPNTYPEPVSSAKWTWAKLAEPSTENTIDGLLMVNKPSGLLSVPGREQTDSLLTRIQQEIHPDAKVCHRLDRDTSGVLALAFNATVHRQISQQFEKRQTVKVYEALVAGHVEKESGSIELPIGKLKTPQGYNQWVIGGNDARPAETHWKVRERLTIQSNNFAFTRLEIQPKTGRGHQIRLHLAHIGHPILGDTLHAPPDIAKASPRLCLHAACLQFSLDTTNVTARAVTPF